jgi:NAD dependent epimerase/dehydratase family enzyme
VCGRYRLSRRKQIVEVRFGLGGATASGLQFVSWIHDADFLLSIDLSYAAKLNWCSKSRRVIPGRLVEAGFQF